MRTFYVSVLCFDRGFGFRAKLISDDAHCASWQYLYLRQHCPLQYKIQDILYCTPLLPLIVHFY